MPIKRRRLKNRREALSRSVAHYLLNGTYPERGQFETWLDVFLLTKRQAYARWLEHRVDLLADGRRTSGSAVDFGLRGRGARRVPACRAVMPVPGLDRWSSLAPAFRRAGLSKCRPRLLPRPERRPSIARTHGRRAAALPPDAEEPEAIDPFLTYEGELEEAIAEGNARRAVEALTRDVSRNGHASHTTHEERDD
jgi:hypothetical protein